MRKLYTGGAATRVDADNATLALRSADAQVAALRAQVDTLLQGTPQDVKSAQGMVDAARGRLQQIDVMLDELIDPRARAPRASSRSTSAPATSSPPTRPPRALLEPAQLYVRDLRPGDADRPRPPRAAGADRRRLVPGPTFAGAVGIGRQPGRVHAAKPPDRRRARRPGVRDARPDRGGRGRAARGHGRAGAGGAVSAAAAPRRSGRGQRHPSSSTSGASSATSSRSTTSASPCRRGRSTACSGPTARASRR